MSETRSTEVLMTGSMRLAQHCMRFVARCISLAAHPSVFALERQGELREVGALEHAQVVEDVGRAVAVDVGERRRGGITGDAVDDLLQLTFCAEHAERTVIHPRVHIAVVDTVSTILEVHVTVLVTRYEMQHNLWLTVEVYIPEGRAGAKASTKGTPHHLPCVARPVLHGAVATDQPCDGMADQ